MRYEAKPAVPYNTAVSTEERVQLLCGSNFWHAGSDYVKEQGELSAAELEELRVCPCSLRCADERQANTGAVAEVCSNSMLSQRLLQIIPLCVASSARRMKGEQITLQSYQLTKMLLGMFITVANA